MSSQDIYQYRKVTDMCSTAGQPTEAQLVSLAEEGFQAVINLATYDPRYSLADEAGLLQSLGLPYYHIPVEWDNPKETDFEAFEQVMQQLADHKLFIHCAANYRVSAFYSLYAQRHLGWSEQEADTFRVSIWQGSDYPVWEVFIRTIKARLTSSPPNPWLSTRTRTGQEYDAPYDARAALGMNVHGEADLILTLQDESEPRPGMDIPYRVLDAGCGTGRIAIELARRGVAVVGVDLDPVMLAQARLKAPQLDWRLGDLAMIEIGQRFDCVVLAGNVMIYLTPGTEAATLHNMAGHLRSSGLLVAAFELQPPAWSNLTLQAYDDLAAAAGLKLVKRWSTWQQDVWRPDDRYAVSVHRK